MAQNYLSKLSEDISQLKPNTTYIKKPNIKNVNQVYFIRYMGEYFLEQFKQHLYEVLASITRTVFDDANMSKERIRDILKKR